MSVVFTTVIQSLKNKKANRDSGPGSKCIENESLGVIVKDIKTCIFAEVALPVWWPVAERRKFSSLVAKEEIVLIHIGMPLIRGAQAKLLQALTYE